MLGAPCSPCCGCNVSETVAVIASKSCSINLSGYIPKIDAASFVYVYNFDGISFGSTVAAFPRPIPFTAYNPSNTQLTRELFGDTGSVGLLTLVYPAAQMPSSAPLALKSIQGQKVTFEATGHRHLFRVSVDVFEQRQPYTQSIDGSRCFFAFTVQGILWDEVEENKYRYTNANDNLIPAEMAANIDPQENVRIVVEDSNPFPASYGGGTIRTGIIRVAAPYYYAGEFGSLNTNASVASVFSSDIRSNKYEQPSNVRYFDAYNAATTIGMSSIQNSISTSGAIDSSLTIIATDASPNDGRRWADYTPRYPSSATNPSWGINPVFKDNIRQAPPFDRMSPSVWFSLSPQSYEKRSPRQEPTFMQVSLE